ncbi:unnamed protein product [Didymodactylos carnosus]|uniref:Thiamin pyrophosphokinase thiamin-binding domain-containing protein n=1 Tax=Didymodactylos carnosus TaxID=1234261 RepID=A0A815KCM6_9BILA|nr:unnamed protein product [Didymodactylos carnosus]CAF1393857.1 unnamed protein product [Didymodactylos carnosus]CAF3703627.1 unnamed protein product [Didymodactylos carnosus]CAF4288129.1 unnamed protein product [Didymodactylos carnosus]
MTTYSVTHHHYPYNVFEKHFHTESTSQLSYGIIILNHARDSLDKLLTKPLWKNAKIRGCADGGANMLKDFTFKLVNADEKNHFIPDYISGDMDSITSTTKNYYAKYNVQLIHTPDQNATDFTKCIQIMLERSSLDVIYIFSTFGGRFDQAMSIIHTLYLFPTIELYLVTDEDITFVLRPGYNHIHIKSPLRGEYCSLLPIAGPVTSVSTKGLKWNLDGNTTLDFHTLVSSSNAYDEELLKSDVADHVEVCTEKDLVWSMTYNVNLICA